MPKCPWKALTRPIELGRHHQPVQRRLVLVVVLDDLDDRPGQEVHQLLGARRPAPSRARRRRAGWRRSCAGCSAARRSPDRPAGRCPAARSCWRRRRTPGRRSAWTSSTTSRRAPRTGRGCWGWSASARRRCRRTPRAALPGRHCRARRTAARPPACRHGRAGRVGAVGRVGDQDLVAPACRRVRGGRRA